MIEVNHRSTPLACTYLIDQCCALPEDVSSVEIQPFLTEEQHVFAGAVSASSLVEMNEGVAVFDADLLLV